MLRYTKQFWMEKDGNRSTFLSYIWLGTFCLYYRLFAWTYINEEGITMERMAWVRNVSLGKVLEIGCADSVIFLHSDDVEWTGIDIELKEEWKPLLEGRDFHIMDGYKMTFPHEHFDTIVYAEILEHVEDPYLFVVSGLKHLKPGGRLVFTIPDEWSWDEELKPFEHPEHIHFFKEPDIRNIMEALENEHDLEIKQFIHTPKSWNAGFVFWYVLLRKEK